MNLTELTAISPVDGRYRNKCERLDEYFSEYALIRYRVKVEIEYFIALCEIPLGPLATVNHDVFVSLRDIYKNFTVNDAARIKEIESVTNHDVKAVEYFLKERFDALGLESYKEFIHFGGYQQYRSADVDCRCHTRHIPSATHRNDQPS